MRKTFCSLSGSEEQVRILIRIWGMSRDLARLFTTLSDLPSVLCSTDEFVTAVFSLLGAPCPARGAPRPRGREARSSSPPPAAATPTVPGTTVILHLQQQQHQQSQVQHQLFFTSSSSNTNSPRYNSSYSPPSAATTPTVPGTTAVILHIQQQQHQQTTTVPDTVQRHFFASNCSNCNIQIGTSVVSFTVVNTSFNQCCGSGMIYSGSGSSNEFVNFRPGYYPYYLSIYGKKKKYLCHFPFHTSHCTHSTEFTGLKLDKIFLFICSFIFCWIRIQHNNSGSRKKFRVQPDSDPQNSIQ